MLARPAQVGETTAEGGQDPDATEPGRPLGVIGCLTATVIGSASGSSRLALIGMPDCDCHRFGVRASSRLWRSSGCLTATVVGSASGPLRACGLMAARRRDRWPAACRRSIGIESGDESAAFRPSFSAALRRREAGDALGQSTRCPAAPAAPSPRQTISGVPPARAATTGLPGAAASRGTREGLGTRPRAAPPGPPPRRDRASPGGRRPRKRTGAPLGRSPAPAAREQEAGEMLRLTSSAADRTTGPPLPSDSFPTYRTAVRPAGRDPSGGDAGPGQAAAAGCRRRATARETSPRAQLDLEHAAAHARPRRPRRSIRRLQPSIGIEQREPIRTRARRARPPPM